MKNKLFLLLCVIFLLAGNGASVISVSGAATAGTGVAVTPDTSWYNAQKIKPAYNISTQAQLAGLAQLVNIPGIGFGENQINTFKGVTLRLTGDITLTGQWTPIGNSDMYSFQGTFEGNGHTISGLSITNAGQQPDPGLFGYLKGTVKDLKVEGTIHSASDEAGGIAGHMDSGAIVSHCTSIVEISAGNKVGGIAGNNQQGQISDCDNQGNISGSAKVGGIAGENWGGSILVCSNEGTVTSTGQGVGTYGTGGIAGRSVAGTASIKESVNKGTVKSENECTGGIVGYMNARGSALNSCYNIGAVTGSPHNPFTDTFAGGVAGSIGVNGVKVENCYNAGLVKGANYVGGVLGNFSANDNENVGSYISNNFYLDSQAALAIGREKQKQGRASYGDIAEATSSGALRNSEMAATLGPSFVYDIAQAQGYPILAWQQKDIKGQKQLVDFLNLDYLSSFQKFFTKHPFGMSYSQYLQNNKKD